MGTDSASGAVAHDAALNQPMMRALLNELAAKLNTLVETGEAQQIDLRRLPLPSGALTALKDWLGRGEIEATVRALAVTTIRETAIAGVWWVTHAKVAGHMLDEHLEITRCPALLMTHPGDIRTAARALQLRLHALDMGTNHEAEPHSSRSSGSQ